MSENDLVESDKLNARKNDQRIMLPYISWPVESRRQAWSDKCRKIDINTDNGMRKTKKSAILYQIWLTYPLSALRPLPNIRCKFSRKINKASEAILHGLGSSVFISASCQFPQFANFPGTEAALASHGNESWNTLTSAGRRWLGRRVYEITDNGVRQK